jgi:hypothetical protein
MHMGISSKGAQRRHAIGALLFAVAACVAAAVRADEPAGTWTMKSPLPAARGEVAAVALDGKLHALGGSVSGTAGPYHDAYDPATERGGRGRLCRKGAIISPSRSPAAKSMRSAVSSARCIKAPVLALSNMIR